MEIPIDRAFKIGRGGVFVLRGVFLGIPESRPPIQSNQIQSTETPTKESLQRASEEGRASKSPAIPLYYRPYDIALFLRSGIYVYVTVLLISCRLLSPRKRRKKTMIYPPQQRSPRTGNKGIRSILFRDKTSGTAVLYSSSIYTYIYICRTCARV